jgi:T-complex protein 1 subunit alpha
LKHLCNLDTLELRETVENEEENDNVSAYSYDNSFSLEIKTIGNKSFLLIAKEPNPSSSIVNTIVIHGPSDIIVQEINRALHDALSVIEKLLCYKYNIPEEDKASINDLVGGGGNVEVNLWKALNEYSLTIYNSKIQLVLRAFADALLIIPRQLLASVCRPQEIEYELSQLKLAHKSSPCEWCEVGIDVTSKNRICSVIERGIIDSFQTKMSMIQLATEACIMLLRIDESIYCPPSTIQRKS